MARHYPVTEAEFARISGVGQRKLQEFGAVFIAEIANHLRTNARQIFADVNKNGKVERIETFNGNYGLNRGLSASCLVLAVVSATQLQWSLAAASILLAAVFAYRAYRFGKHYARELYVQFLVLSDTPIPKT